MWMSINVQSTNQYNMAVDVEEHTQGRRTVLYLYHSICY